MSSCAEDGVCAITYLNSVKIAAVATAVCPLLGYPVASAIAAAPSARKPTLINLPFWTSFLIRIHAWIVVLSKEGAEPHSSSSPT